MGMTLALARATAPLPTGVKRRLGMMSASAEPTSLFSLLEDGSVLPTDFSRGPWDPRSLHGGPVAALLANAVEQIPADGVDWFVARLTVELERPVPVEPLTVLAEVTRPGRKVSIVEASIKLTATNVVLARARALRIRSADVPLPIHDDELGPLLAVEPAPPGPEHGASSGTLATEYTGFHNGGIESRFLGDPEKKVGPVVAWIRMRVPVLPTVPLTPLQRVAGAADFANGISRVLSFDSHFFVNPDLTIHLFRPLIGEWVGMASATHHGPSGVGMTDTAVFDINGRVGSSNQSLLLDVR